MGQLFVKGNSIIAIHHNGKCATSFEKNLQQKKNLQSMASQSQPCARAHLVNLGIHTTPNEFHVGTGEVLPQLVLRVPYTWISETSGSLFVIREHILNLVEALKDTDRVMLGVDTEWGDGPHLGPSVVQIAVEGAAWVLDTLYGSEDYLDEARSLLLFLFSHHSVTTVGWSFSQDLVRLKAFLGHDLRFSNLMDLQGPALIACREVHKHGTPSLATCCRVVIAQSLDKTEQCSDWDRRPLSEAQLRYAALDAHVLTTLSGELSHPR